MYNYVIVGGGPCGLTMAWLLSKVGKVLIIEKNSVVGGCHRVIRVDGLFTEHGPRMYPGNSYTFQMILEDMGLSFDDIFVKYHLNTFGISKDLLREMSFKEIWTFITAYLRYFIDSSFSKSVSMKQFMSMNGFSKKTMENVDAIGRFTDGAGMDRYTLHEFLEIINQNFMYNIYQPKKPHDVGLFKDWVEKLKETNNVDIVLNGEVMRVNDGILTYINDGREFDIDYEKCIFAIPPVSLMKVLIRSGIEYEGFQDFTEKTKYLQYVSVIFHWNKKVDVNDPGYTIVTDWKIVSVTLSDYMDFEDDRSQTVVSTELCDPDGYSEYLGKYVNDCTKDELVNEMFRQLKIHLNQDDLEEPTYKILSPKIYKKDGKWFSDDSAFILTTDGYWNKIEISDGLYTAGSHCGFSDYCFTSMETAVSNGIAIAHKLAPLSHKYQVKTFLTMGQVIGSILLIIIIITYFIK